MIAQVKASQLGNLVTIEQLKLSVSNAETFGAVRVATAFDSEEDPRVKYLSASAQESWQWDFPTCVVTVTAHPNRVDYVIEMKSQAIALAAAAEERRAA